MEPVSQTEPLEPKPKTTKHEFFLTKLLKINRKIAFLPKTEKSAGQPGPAEPTGEFSTYILVIWGNKGWSSMGLNLNIVLRIKKFGPEAGFKKNGVFAF